MNKILGIALVVIALIATGGYFFPQAVVSLGGTTNYDDLGVLSLKIGTGCSDSFLFGTCTSSSGTSVDADGDFITTGSVTLGGDDCTLTDATGGAYTLSESELQECSYFTFAAGGAGQAVIALTAPATSTLTSFLAQPGQCKSFVYDATALVAATTTTMTAGTGFNLVAYTTNDDVIDGGEYSSWTMCREPDTDMYWKVSEDVAAD